MNIIVLHSKPYNFQDKQTKKDVSGIKLQYIFNDDLSPISIENDEKGYQIAESSIPYSAIDSITKVPAVYKANFITRVNNKNQPVQKLIDIDYICSVSELFTTKK